jgi:hypothetical protein
VNGDTVDVATFVVECTWLPATDFMCLCPPTARLSCEEENGHAPRSGRRDAEEHGGLLPASLLVHSGVVLPSSLHHGDDAA